MNEVECTVQWFREQARQDGIEFIVLDGSGYLLMCGIPPKGPGWIGFAPVESDEAVELIRRSIEEFGCHWLTEGRMKGGEAELTETMRLFRKTVCSARLSEEALRRVAEKHLRREHAVLHCTFPMADSGLFDAWLNPNGVWETDHPGISSECLTQAVKAFLAVLEQE